MVYSSSQTQYIFALVFLFWETGSGAESFDLLILRRHSVAGEETAKKFYLGYPKMVFCNREFEASCSDALEDAFDVFDYLLRGICGNSYVVNVLRTLICFDYRVQVLSLEA